MFKNIFKRKPKHSNQAFEDLSIMLTQEKVAPTYKRELLNIDKLDFSLESFNQLDDYLNIIRKDDLPEDDFMRLVLRTGAYVGEVMRKNSNKGFKWLDYEEAKKVSDLVNHNGKHLGTVAILWSEKNGQCFPLAKIMKFIENGPEDSTYFFAKVLMSKSLSGA